MPKGYVVVTEDIKDPEGIKAYMAEAAKSFSPDIKILAMDANAEFVEGDAKGLGKRLAHKGELLRKAAEIYGEVVSFRVSEWMTAALYKIGRSYELFAESLREVSVPAGLSEQEEQTYRDELAKFIVPIEERALEAYESGYRKALELHVFNTWTEKQRQALTRLNDVEYPPLREAGTELADAQPLPLPIPLSELRRTQADTDKPQPSKKTKPKAKAKPKPAQAKASGQLGAASANARQP